MKRVKIRNRKRKTRNKELENKLKTDRITSSLTKNKGKGGNPDKLIRDIMEMDLEENKVKYTPNIYTK
jgi:hypothetical protein